MWESCATNNARNTASATTVVYTYAKESNTMNLLKTVILMSVTGLVASVTGCALEAGDAKAKPSAMKTTMTNPVTPSRGNNHNVYETRTTVHSEVTLIDHGSDEGIDDEPYFDSVTNEVRSDESHFDKDERDEETVLVVPAPLNSQRTPLEK